jgi:hypothetical protein
MNSNINRNIKNLIERLGITPYEFSKQIGNKRADNIYNVINEKVEVSTTTINKIFKRYPEYKDFVLSGSDRPSDSIQFYNSENMPFGKKLIPLYDDVSTIGGNLPGPANMEANNPPAEWIDPGDWFKNATAAIRHYGESMIEYPMGCILALKEVQDRRLLVPGKDYVIETSEYRMTKRVQLCNDPEYIRLYSTNEEKYDDGSLIYQPFNISLELVNRIFEVLGYVVKKGSETMVYSNLK